MWYSTSGLRACIILNTDGPASTTASSRRAAYISVVVLLSITTKMYSRLRVTSRPTKKAGSDSRYSSMSLSIARPRTWRRTACGRICVSRMV